MTFPFPFMTGKQWTGGNDANTKLLLHMDGSNGGTTFTDSSATGATVTKTGNGQTSTAQTKFGTASYLGDGSGDYLTVTANAAFNLGSGAWTVDFWARPHSYSDYGMLCDLRQTTDPYLNIYTVVTSGYLYADIGANAASEIHTSSAITIDNWAHIALVKSGSTITLYLNGTSIGSHSDSTTFDNSAQNWTIGIHRNLSNYSYNGYIDEFRVSDVARWTANFTPPSAAYF